MGCSPWGHKESDMAEKLSMQMTLHEVAGIKTPQASSF